MSAITLDGKGPRLDSERKPRRGNRKSLIPFTRRRRSKGIGVAHLKGLSEPGPGINVWGDVRPCQYWHSRDWTGEQKLCEGILWDAFACLRGVGGQQEQEKALAWIRSTDRSYTFDFERICDTLGLEAECIRAGILGKEAA